MSHKHRILVVDDQIGVPGELQDNFLLKYEDLPCEFVFESCMTGVNRFWSYKAVERIRREKDLTLVLLDIKFGTETDRLGLEILERIGQEAPLLPVIMLTSLTGDTSTVVKAIQLGAKDYVVKDPTPEELVSLIERHAVARSDPWQIIGVSDGILRLREAVDRAARFNASALLITGERGSGKEMVARGVYSRGSRSGHAFVDVNCAAIAPELFEAEMFGAQRGSYTGSDKDRFGFLELAAGGVLFLDEIGEMPLAQQPKLLRALEQRTFRRLGVSDEISSDFQLICATNADLAARAKEGRFREDLYDRIRAVEIRTPPLRECREDVPSLTAHFAQLIAFREKHYSRVCTDFTPQAMEALAAYDWPGNVRELRQAVEYAIFMANGKRIDLEHLRPEIRVRPDSRSGGLPTGGPHPLSDDASAGDFAIWQLDIIRRVYESTGRNQAATMRRLFPGLKESYFGRVAWDMVRKYPDLIDPSTPAGLAFGEFSDFRSAYERTVRDRERARLAGDESDGT